MFIQNSMLLKQIKAESGFTYPDIADYLGINVLTAKRYFSGLHSIPIHHLNKLRTKLQFTDDQSTKIYAHYGHAYNVKAPGSIIALDAGQEQIIKSTSKQTISDLPGKKTRSLLNRAAVKQFLLDIAPDIRAHQFHRISPSVLVHIESKVREECIRILRAHPSKGKTITM